MTSKVCSICKTEHNAPHSYCRPCKAEYQRNQRKNNTNKLKRGRKEIIYKFKKEYRATIKDDYNGWY